MNVTKEALLHWVIILTTVETIIKTLALTCWHMNPTTAKKRTRWENPMSLAISVASLALLIWAIGLKQSRIYLQQCHSQLEKSLNSSNINRCSLNNSSLRGCNTITKEVKNYE